MSSTIFSLLLAFYMLSKILDTYRHPAILAVSKAVHEPDQSLPGPVSTGQGATLMRGSEVSLIKGLGLLNVLAEGIHVLILFAILLLLGKMFLTAMPLYWGMMRGVALNE